MDKIENYKENPFGKNIRIGNIKKDFLPSPKELEKELIKIDKNNSGLKD